MGLQHPDLQTVDVVFQINSALPLRNDDIKRRQQVTPKRQNPAAAKQGMDAPTAVLIGVTGGLGHALARLLAVEGFRFP